MKCPICRSHSLQKQELEMNLPAHQCRKCGGIWIPAAQYWEWLKMREGTAMPDLTLEIPLPVEPAGRAKICPDCGHILRRYQVWPKVKFYLDRCGHCEGMWFDQNEWDYLKAHGEHDDVRMFFTSAWQEKIRAEEARLWMKSVYLERFGEEDYARLREIRTWLWQHPKRELLMAYLTDRDPYKPVSR